MASLVAEWTAEFAPPSNKAEWIAATTAATGLAAPASASGAAGVASSDALESAVERILKTHLSAQVVQHFDPVQVLAATENYTGDLAWCV